MDKKYIISIDQSTQGTKALLFDHEGKLLGRADKTHCQIIDDRGWVSHDLNEIYANTIWVIKSVVEKTGIEKNKIRCVGISNQRETSCVWNKVTGEPIAPAIVWQCSRAKDICAEVEDKGVADMIRNRTGINLSPFFPASKFSWLKRNIEGAQQLYEDKQLMFGTIDTWLVYKLTDGNSYKTDYSNASRTQLFNLQTLTWDEEICRLFGLETYDLAEVCDSNAVFGNTDFDGFLEHSIPICGVLGDSHGALFGQGCLEKGMVKATYGTGSSVMMNIGQEYALSDHGLVTSLAWGMNGTVNYVLEGNINYTGAVISWLKNDLQLIENAAQSEAFARDARKEDTTYLVPAFTGLGAPYWANDAQAMFYGMTRITGRKELVKAGVESIAYQISDIVQIMKQDATVDIMDLRVDGGPTRNSYLMQFQSDLINTPVQIPDAEELSGIGAAYMAGMAIGMFDEDVFKNIKRSQFVPRMEPMCRDEKLTGWKHAVQACLGYEKQEM